MFQMVLSAYNVSKKARKKHICVEWKQRLEKCKVSKIKTAATE